MENSKTKTIEKEKLVAETLNGRFAMIGLIAVLLIEAISKISFLEWAGIISN